MLSTKNIVTLQDLTCANVYVIVPEPTNRSIIISASEIIISKFVILVVSSATVWIECWVGIGTGDVVIGCYAIAQGIVSIRDEPYTYLIVNSHNITSQILLEPENVEVSCGCCASMVLYTCVEAVRVVEADNEIGSSFLSDYSRTLKMMGVNFASVYNLWGTNAFISHKRVAVINVVCQPSREQ